MARFLLDTHIVLWYLDQSDRLSSNALAIIENPENEIFISVASYWEMTIKSSLKKLILPEPISHLIRKSESGGLQTLGINEQDLTVLHELDYHHRDPFGRMIIAQCYPAKHFSNKL